MMKDLSVDIIADNLLQGYMARIRTWIVTEVKKDSYELSVSYPATWW
jgi:hypothetical protein